MDGNAVRVSRWTRYGKDRLYVALPDETPVGFWDLVAGQARPVSAEHMSIIVNAMETWQAGHGGGNGRAERTPAARPTPVAPIVVSAPPHAPPNRERAAAPPGAPPGAVAATAKDAWRDLSGNRAGAQARERALAARRASPVRTVLARALGVHTDERAWRIGADGEELVAAQLAKAGKRDPRWQFLHAIPVGNHGSDIDHLVVGPGGVFTVNAKHHPNAKIWVAGSTFLVDGHKQPYIRNSRHEAARAARLLTAVCGFPVHVEGLIVTVNARDVVVRGAPDGVHIAARRQLPRWLLGRGDILAPQIVQAVYEAARRSTTWQV